MARTSYSSRSVSFVRDVSNRLSKFHTPTVHIQRESDTKLAYLCRAGFLAMLSAVRGSGHAKPFLHRELPVLDMNFSCSLSRPFFLRYTLSALINLSIRRSLYCGHCFGTYTHGPTSFCDQSWHGLSCESGQIPTGNVTALPHCPGTERYHWFDCIQTALKGCVL